MCCDLVMGRDIMYGFYSSYPTNHGKKFIFIPDAHCIRCTRFNLLYVIHKTGSKGLIEKVGYTSFFFNENEWKNSFVP